AGISDNFGLSDAVRFMFAFRDWIEENTSGVIIVSIRDSPKRVDIQERKAESIIDGVSQPISSVYNNFENFQDITNAILVCDATSWFDVPIDRIDLEHEAEADASVITELDSLRQHSPRASLSWRLTAREKQGIIQNIATVSNRAELERLRGLLNGERKPESAGEMGAVGSRQDRKSTRLNYSHVKISYA